MLRIQAGAASDAGHRHEVNEDRVLAGRTVFAVADGMGGHAAGEVASALAVARLGRLDEETVLTPDVFRAHLAAANADIVASGARDPRWQGMGAAVAGIGVARVAGMDHWVVFNVGDCRVYRLAKDRLTRLTSDHNEAAGRGGRGGREGRRDRSEHGGRGGPAVRTAQRRHPVAGHRTAVRAGHQGPAPGHG